MNHSDELSEIAAALSAFQGEAEAVAKGSVNPFFSSRYADLASVVKAASPILTKHGLSVAQIPGTDEHGDTLTTCVLHKSGQWLAGTMRLRPVKNDPQAQGSAITYGRRYAYMAALGLVADDDDDGNAASRGAANGQQGRQITARPPQETVPLATAKQRGLINAKAGEKELSSLALLNIVRAAGGSDEPLNVPDDKARTTLSKAMDRLPRDLVDPVLAAIEQVDDVMPEPVA